MCEFFFRIRVRVPITQRNRGRSLEQVIGELNSYLNGWLNYFKLASAKSLMGDLDSWIRRKLRCYKLKQKKRGSSIAKLLLSLGIHAEEACKIGSSGKGWWRLSLTQAIHRALNNEWFKQKGLINLQETWVRLLNLNMESPYATTHVRWCERTGAVRLPPTRSSNGQS